MKDYEGLFEGRIIINPSNPMKQKSKILFYFAKKDTLQESAEPNKVTQS
jgi:hypothetical protein